MLVCRHMDGPGKHDAYEVNQTQKGKYCMITLA